MLGDFAGGSLYLAFGLVCGILEARRSGQGQIVDAAMIDGAASLMTAAVGAVAAGLSTHERGTNHLDTGAHFYNVYECADGGWISIAPIEGKFYAELLAPPRHRPGDDAAANGPRALARGAGPVRRVVQDPHPGPMVRLARRDRRLLRTGADAPTKRPITRTTPRARTYVEIDGIVQPAPAPRFSRTVPDLPIPPQPTSPETAEAALAAWLDPAEIAALKAAGTIG